MNSNLVNLQSVRGGAGNSLLALLVLFSIVVAGCGGHPKDASDWSYTPPDGFKQQEKQERGDTVFNGPMESGFPTNLRVKSGTNSVDNAEKIGKQTLVKVLALQGVTLKEQEPYTLADSDCYTWQVTRKLQNGTLASQRQFVVLKNGVAVLFTLTAPDSTFSKWDQALADSLQSFKWGRS
jgi:hypothetical protein